MRPRAVPLQHADADPDCVRELHGFMPNLVRCLVSALQGDHPSLWLWVGGHAVGGWVLRSKVYADGFDVF